MPDTLKHDIKSIVANFAILGDFISASPYGSGHINDTYVANFNQSGTPIRYIVQRINHDIFKQPIALMQNIKRVTDHQREKLTSLNENDISRSCLTLVDTHDNAPYHKDEANNVWRIYLFIENATSHDVVQSPQQAYEAAKAFGRFQMTLVDLPGEPLIETIPDFHNTPVRFTTFQKILALDELDRAKDCQPEIDFALSWKDKVNHLLDLNTAGEIPTRTTHNDTKLNNVLLDNDTQKGTCVIDLDTCMPGLALYDFGDLVRTATSPAEEDERDLTKVTMQLHMFEALAKGYLESARSFLTPAEKDNLVFSGKLIPFEIGLRFLTDHLQGDVYFKTHRQNHNLDRCRTQFKLIKSIEKQQKAMDALVKKL